MNYIINHCCTKAKNVISDFSSTTYISSTNCNYSTNAGTPHFKRRTVTIYCAHFPDI